ncbi:MAG: radical SAM family heme chaperone HemW, partial [Myxococcota bacterium]
MGVYLHLPFCERVCPYCDFAVVAARTLDPADEDRYVVDLLSELSARAEHFAGRALASVYFGGGTPALFRPESIERLVAAIGDTFPAAEVPPEVTLELNPSTVERARLPGFRAAGVNRLSIGVQSFDDGLLKRLGRAHRASVAEETLAAARAADFDDLSLDLIFAGPGQSAADLDRDLDRVIDFRPEHVSTYELTFEPQTPFGRAVADGRMAPPDEDLAAAMIERVEQRLESAGYARYEISSYARPGRRARHNARYWQRQAVLGLGLGAHSTEARRADRP